MLYLWLRKKYLYSLNNTGSRREDKRRGEKQDRIQPIFLQQNSNGEELVLR